MDEITLITGGIGLNTSDTTLETIGMIEGAPGRLRDGVIDTPGISVVPVGKTTGGSVSKEVGMTIVGAVSSAVGMLIDSKDSNEVGMAIVGAVSNDVGISSVGGLSSEVGMLTLGMLRTLDGIATDGTLIAVLGRTTEGTDVGMATLGTESTVVGMATDGIVVGIMLGIDVVGSTMGGTIPPRPPRPPPPAAAAVDEVAIACDEVAGFGVLTEVGISTRTVCSNAPAVAGKVEVSVTKPE